MRHHLAVPPLRLLGSGGPAEPAWHRQYNTAGKCDSKLTEIPAGSFCSGKIPATLLVSPPTHQALRQCWLPGAIPTLIRCLTSASPNRPRRPWWSARHSAPPPVAAASSHHSRLQPAEYMTRKGRGVGREGERAKDDNKDRTHASVYGDARVVWPDRTMSAPRGGGASAAPHANLVGARRHHLWGLLFAAAATCQPAQKPHCQQPS